mgnify:CR=1 FL=1
MINTKELSRSTRTFVRREKARIRREFLDFAEQEKRIKEIYQKFFHDDKRNLQSSDTKGN